MQAFHSSAFHDDLTVDLVMSHLACADVPQAALNRRQLERFKGVCDAFPGVRARFANTAGVFLGHEYHFDLVRPGIGLFGHDPHYKFTAPRVEPVATLEASLGQVSQVPADESIGYGATVRCDSDTSVGTVLIGYADGVPRSLSKSLHGKPMTAHIDGHRVSVFGRISMDLMTIDLSGLDCLPSPGQMVEIFGGHVSIKEIADHVGTIPYELLTGIARRVRREYRK